MGLGGINLTQLLIILAIVILIFGTKRLKTLGGDLGGAIKGFRKAMDSEDKGKEADDEAAQRRIESGSDEAPDAEFTEQKKEKHG